ncbi:MAG: hypothetical protein ACLRRT_01055 [Ruthenibacterium lactatiformans]
MGVTSPSSRPRLVQCKGVQKRRPAGKAVRGSGAVESMREKLAAVAQTEEAGA